MGSKERETARNERIERMAHERQMTVAANQARMQEIMAMGIQMHPLEFPMSAIETLIEVIAGGMEERIAEIGLKVETDFHRKLMAVDLEAAKEEVERRAREAALLTGNLPPEQMESAAREMLLKP